MLTSQDWQEDLAFLAETLLSERGSYGRYESAKSIDREVQSLYGCIPTLAEHQIIVKMSGLLAAFGERAFHFGLPFNPTIAFQQFPITLEIFQNGVFITGTAPLYQALMCAQVLQIGNCSIETAVETIRPLCRHSDGSQDELLSHIVIPEVLHTFGIIDRLAMAEILVVNDAGQRQRIEVESISFEHGTASNVGSLIGAGFKSLQHTAETYAYFLPNSGIGVFKYRTERSFTDLTPIGAFRHKRI
jgi:hypothetical protein